MEATTLETELGAFTGTENYYRHHLVRHLVYTDGVKYLAEKGGAYWLIDAIASYQTRIARMPDQRLHEMQFWTLEVNEDKSAVLYCIADLGEQKAVMQQIEFTDFPMRKMQLWVVRQDAVLVMMLPSEY